MKIIIPVILFPNCFKVNMFLSCSLASKYKKNSLVLLPILVKSVDTYFCKRVCMRGINIILHLIFLILFCKPADSFSAEFNTSFESCNCNEVVKINKLTNKVMKIGWYLIYYSISILN